MKKHENTCIFKDFKDFLKFFITVPDSFSQGEMKKVRIANSLNLR